MSELRGPEAHMACLILGGEPWTLADAETARHSISYGGAKAMVSAAIGGLAGWIDGDACAAAMSHALAQLYPSGEAASYYPEWTEAFFIAEAAMSLRDNALGTRDKVEDNPKNEYAFCISDFADCQRLGALRASMGLKWSEERLARCALAMVDAMDKALARDEVGVEAISHCAPELVARLELIESIRPRLLEFLLKWKPKMAFPSGKERSGMGCCAYEGQDSQTECCELGRIGWDWVVSAKESRGRTDFPWGFWLAWTAPSLLDAWGPALAVDCERDGRLAREISGFSYDRDEWNEKETEAAMGTAAALERAALLSASEPAGKSERRRSL